MPDGVVLPSVVYFVGPYPRPPELTEFARRLGREGAGPATFTSLTLAEMYVAVSPAIAGYLPFACHLSEPVGHLLTVLKDAGETHVVIDPKPGRAVPLALLKVG